MKFDRTAALSLAVAAVLLVATGCSAAPAIMDSGTHLCTPGETRTCACLNGMGMGAQACNADGAGYSDCGPCTATRCGDGTCNGTETCSSCTMDCHACAAMCGDHTCNGTETCTSCPADCGACMTPRCGDGTCNGSETCTTCADDCGACPPMCGDGTCNGTETCSSCALDCGACGTSCLACSTNSDCPAPATCGVRRCDGVRGCYADATASCSSIGGVQCPPTAAYNLCLTDAECGPYAACQQFGDGRRFCARRCAADTDCPAPPAGSTTHPSCDAANTPRTCFLVCSGPGTCPYGLSCFRFMDGTYGYCS